VVHIGGKKGREGKKARKMLTDLSRKGGKKEATSENKGKMQRSG